MKEYPEKINLDKLRALASALKASWEYRNSGQCAYDLWNEEYADDQIPRALEALDLCIQGFQSLADEKREPTNVESRFDNYYTVTNR